MFKKLNLKQKPPEISLALFNLIFAFFLTLGLNFSFFHQLGNLNPNQGIQHFLFILASMLVLTTVYNLIFQLIHWKFNSKIFAVFWIVLGALNAYFVNSLGILITPDQIQNMLQTDSHELLDLINIRFVMWLCLFVFIPLFVLSMVKIKADHIKNTVFAKVAYSLASLFIVAGLLFTYYVDYAAIFRENRDLKGMLSPQNFITSSLSYYKKQNPQVTLPLLKYGEDAHLIKQVHPSSQAKIMLLVVGETARAESFSLNGYTKNTNPQLAKLDIINFSNVSSCGTATAVSVPCMFSGMTRNNYDAQLAKHREGLLDIAQRAGYKVTWIDNNSGCKDVCNRVEQFTIPEDLKSKWCTTDGDCYDEILVESLKRYLSQIPIHDTQSRLIVLHQMGSHGPAYYKRATAEFQHFKPTCDSKAIQGCTREQLLNSYDNSILYTDHVLSQLIAVLKSKSQVATGLWYISDHGESTGESGLYLHGAPYAIAPNQQTHVPMLMWFSAAWKQNQRADYSCLLKLKQAELSQDNLFPTLINLLSIKTTTANQQLNMLKQCQGSSIAKA